MISLHIHSRCYHCLCKYIPIHISEIQYWKMSFTLAIECPKESEWGWGLLILCVYVFLVHFGIWYWNLKILSYILNLALCTWWKIFFFPFLHAKCCSLKSMCHQIIINTSDIMIFCNHAHECSWRTNWRNFTKILLFFSITQLKNRQRKNHRV